MKKNQMIKREWRTHGNLYPHSLTTRQSSHLVDIGKVKLPLIRPIHGRKHILLPRLPQQALDGDLPARQTVRPGSLAPMGLVDPAPVDEDGGAAAAALEGRDDHVSVLAVAHARPDEHFLVVPETACRAHAAVVKVVDGGGVNGRG